MKGKAIFIRERAFPTVATVATMIALALFACVPSRSAPITFTDAGFIAKLPRHKPWSVRDLSVDRVIVDTGNHTLVYLTCKDGCPGVHVRSLAGRKRFDHSFRDEVAPIAEVLIGSSTILVTCHGPNMGAMEYADLESYAGGYRRKRIYAFDHRTGHIRWSSNIYESGIPVWCDGGRLYLATHSPNRDIGKPPFDPERGTIELRSLASNRVLWQRAMPGLTPNTKVAVRNHDIILSSLNDSGKSGKTSLRIPVRFAIHEHHAAAVFTRHE